MKIHAPVLMLLLSFSGLVAAHRFQDGDNTTSITQEAVATAVSQDAEGSEPQLRKLLQRYTDAKTDEHREDLKDQIQVQLSAAYTQSLEAYDGRISRLRDRLEEMETQVESHRTAMDDMIELRLEWLIKNAELGELPPLGLYDRLRTDHPDVPRPPKAADVPAAFPDLASALSHGEKNNAAKDSLYATRAKIFFASEKTLKNGELIIDGISDPGDRTTITFSEERDSIGATLRPGKYTYTYTQDGKVWGKGEFVKLESKRQYLEIESGEFTTHMLEKHKVTVTFEAAAANSANLFVQGVDNDYQSNELADDFDGQLESNYLPGQYVVIFSNPKYRSIQSFTVKPGKPMTVNLDREDDPNRPNK